MGGLAAMAAKFPADRTKMPSQEELLKLGFSNPRSYLEKRFKLENAAASVVQKCIRKRAARRDWLRLLEMLPQLDQLKAKFGAPDPSANTEANENYSTESILRRAALRSDKAVLAALEYAWLACSGMDELHDGAMSFDECAAEDRTERPGPSGVRSPSGAKIEPIGGGQRREIEPRGGARCTLLRVLPAECVLSLIHISEPTRRS
eukprot:6475596-Prymnesium_polylepis.1